MNRLALSIVLTAASTLSLAGLVLANNAPTANESYPVVAQLALRDHTLVITSAPSGYRYSVANTAGSILSANLTERQMAEQYPELLDKLRPAVADENTQLMMLAPLGD